jgi:hypothetical protein
MLAIGNYMIKTLEFSSEIWETIRLVHYKSISVWPIIQNKIITELELK